MRKTYQIDGIDCANCAAKLEDKIGKIKEVDDVTINFFTSKIVIESNCESDEQFSIVLEKIRELARKLEPDVTIN